MIDIFILYSSLSFGIDEKLIKAIINTETTNRCNGMLTCPIRSKTKDGGIAQINERFAGIHNISWLYNNEFNIHLATQKLADLKVRLKSTKYWYTAYNTGVKGFLALKDRANFPYTKKIKKNLLKEEKKCLLPNMLLETC